MKIMNRGDGLVAGRSLTTLLTVVSIVGTMVGARRGQKAGWCYNYLESNELRELTQMLSGSWLALVLHYNRRILEVHP